MKTKLSGLLRGKPVWRAGLGLIALAVMLLLVPVRVHAAGELSDADAADVFSQIKQQLSAAFEEMDQETAEEVFSFLKDKLAESDYGSEEGLQSIIKEGKDKFGVEVDKEDARKLVDAMEKLEDMGFSAEYVVDKTESLYQEYGAGFVDHVDEVVTGAVKNAASNAVNGFFENLKKSVKDFFSNLF